MFRFFILIITLSSISFLSYANGDTCKNHHCLAVVDAGSTGSRLHIYAYDLDSRHYPIQIQELWSKKIKPGFSTLELEQDKINDYLTTLFSNAPEKDMPVYFYATAGMRLLPYVKQEVYFQALQQWFQSHSEWLLIDAKTITGREEGVFGWLAVNYQLGRLDTHYIDSDLRPVSVMDMGGASVQVTFPVRDAARINARDLVEIDVYGQPILLFVHSFLGLGQTLMSQQFLDEDSCFPIGYQLTNGLAARGDASACQRSVTKLVTLHEVDRVVKTAQENNVATSWYAIGGLAALAEDPLLNLQNSQFTSQSLVQKADYNICHQRWYDLTSQYPNNDYLYTYCLLSAYYYALVVDGYGINPTQTINLMPANRVADWSLGVVLRQH